jgi:hypothetical protein
MHSMGRKSTAKAQTKVSTANTGGAPPGPPKRAVPPLIVVAVIVVAAIAGVLVATRASQAPPPADAQTATATPPPASTQPPADTVPSAARFGPHKQDRLPPLPYEAMPARPPDVVRAAYVFAAEHPEILSYVPCYCGCERSGHRGNDDCFVAARDAKGDVTEWDPHGAT